MVKNVLTELCSSSPFRDCSCSVDADRNGVSRSRKGKMCIRDSYKPELQKDDMSFLSRSFERHFNERPYLKHTCYLYLTKTTKERSRMQRNFSTLCRGHIIPKELDRETTTKFMDCLLYTSYPSPCAFSSFCASSPG